MAQAQIQKRCLPIVNVNGVPCVMIGTTKDVIYNDEFTLEEALAAFRGEILASAATVTRNDADLADMKAWLIEHLGYTPKQHDTGNVYLTPLMTEIERVPSVSEPAAEPAGESV